MMDPWVLRAIEDEIRKVERDRDEMIKAIDHHQEQVAWRQSAVETAIERIGALRRHIDGSQVSENLTNESRSDG